MEEKITIKKDFQKIFAINDDFAIYAYENGRIDALIGENLYQNVTLHTIFNEILKSKNNGK